LTQISEAEKDIWEDYRINGADFSAGEDVEKPEIREQQLRKETEIFGLWNPEATARKLGFEVENTDGEDEEDDWLAEIIQDVGESDAFRRLEVEVWDKSRWFDQLIDVMVSAKFGPVSSFDAQVRNCSPVFHLFVQYTHIYSSHTNYWLQRPRTLRNSKSRTSSCRRDNGFRIRQKWYMLLNVLSDSS
jgi:hypothetical protein